MERKKIQYLALHQGLFDLERVENTEMLLDLRGLKTITLVLTEKPHQIKSESFFFREPEDWEFSYIPLDFDDDGNMERWPEETKEWIEGHMEAVEEDHVCGVSAPRLEFKFLCPAS